MLKAILFCLILSQMVFSEASYSLGKFSGGTPYIRLKVPESSETWTCFDVNGYSNYIDLAKDSPLKDSIIVKQEMQIELCDRNRATLDSSLMVANQNVALLKNGADSLLTSYKTTEKELASEKIRKYWFGVMGVGIGGLIGGLVTAILIAR